MNPYKTFGIPDSLYELSQKAQERVSETLSLIDLIAEHNSMKVLGAFTSAGISSAHLLGSTGYGFDDSGRDALDRVFAAAFGAESAIVRHNFVSGTHAISTALFGILRPGDRLVCLTGEPYDTLKPIMGLEGAVSGSLRDFGIKCEALPLTDDGAVNQAAISNTVKGAKMAYIQRSRGYSLRPSLSIADIRNIVSLVKSASPETVVFVDNCYGEFTETAEPTAIGADLCAGSLIKNPGGGIAKTGGYIAGRADLVALCADRLTCPGMGTEVGCSLDELRGMYLGLFMAPTVVAAALKSAVFAASLFELLEYETYPASDSPRSDIIQTLALRSPEKLVAFCKAIQRVSPIDSAAAPEPSYMPGYEHDVIMAAGAFTLGASIELSADGPMREPYAVYMQGALSYPYGKIGALSAAHALMGL